MIRFLVAVLFEPKTLLERCVFFSLALLICANVLTLVIGTMPDLEPETRAFIHQFEIVSVVIFGFEYVSRVMLAAHYNPIFTGFRGRLRYMAGPIPLVDLIVLIPFVLPFILPFDLRILRLFRVLRIFTVLRLGRWSEGLRVLAVVIHRRMGELSAVLLITSVVLLLSSSIMYFFEKDAQPEMFGSIPMSLWWGIITLTTVGYGDAAPVTALGKVVGGLIALMGVGLGALPAGILASGLHEEMMERRKRLKPNSDNNNQESSDL